MKAKKQNPRSPLVPAAPEDSPPAPESARPLTRPAAAHASGPRARLDFPVVAMVAAATDLEACVQFFGALPGPAPALALVLLSDQDAGLPGLGAHRLAALTPMPVREIVDGMPAAPGQVHLLPPHKTLLIEGGVFRLHELAAEFNAHVVIDGFLRSLAADQEDQAMGVLLAGARPYGAPGWRAIRARGGLVLVQKPPLSQNRTPSSAVANGVADLVLPVEQMPAAVLAHLRQRPRAAKTGAEFLPRMAEHQDRILALLRSCNRVDFRFLRKEILACRLERRMRLNQLQEVRDYLAYVAVHPPELRHLSRDLLLNPSRFFSAPQEDQELQERGLLPLLEARTGAAPLRVWVPGCATGEEAYTIGMLILEQRAALRKQDRVQIFATDLDEQALAIARKGIYPASIAAEISPARLQRFFTRIDEHHYQVHLELRECMYFAIHHVVADAPIGKIDLISCRQMLACFEPEMHRKILRLFHYALAEGGLLLLDSSAAQDALGGLFEPISRQCRLFRRLPARKLALADFFLPEPGAASLEVVPPRAPLPAPTVNYASLTQRLLLQSLPLAAALVNSRHEILHLHGLTSRYLNLASAKPPWHVLKIAVEELRPSLHTALLRAGLPPDVAVPAPANRAAAVTAQGEIHRAGVAYPVKLTVQPVRPSHPGDEGLLLIIFEETPATLSAEVPAEEDLIQQFKIIRAELQQTIEHLGNANQELLTSHEEMISLHEELQFSYEKLDTSREELQSLNEQLLSANHQLKHKVLAVESMSSDLVNLLHGTEVATLFLDRQGLIKLFTPASQKLFNLIDKDIGRPIHIITQKFTDGDLLEEMDSVLRDGLSREKEVSTREGSWYVRRILPYYSLDHQQEGVVLTFTDVTRIKQAEIALHQNQELRLLATVLRDSNDAVMVHDLQGNIRDWNRTAETMYGYTKNEALHMNMAQLLPEDSKPTFQELLDEVRSQGKSERLAVRRRCKDGSILDVWLNATLLRDEANQPVAIATTERDITRRNQLEQELLEIAAREQRRIGQELHDSSGQELVALALIAQTLAESLHEESSADAPLAAKLAAGIKRTLRQVRDFARGLIPVEVDTEGLSAALHNLAARISELQNISCVFEQDRPVVLLKDQQAATHLFRIAQEAVTNALQHGHARHITLFLGRVDQRLALQIRDDGVGIPDPLPETGGMGLRIMQYRAELIHAQLHLESLPGGGTLVSCFLAPD